MRVLCFTVKILYSNSMLNKSQLLTNIGLIYIILIFIFWLISEFVERLRTKKIANFDKKILLKINSFSTPFLDKLMVLITDFGGVIIPIVISFSLLNYFIKINETKKALFVLVGILGTLLINIVLKTLIRRNRPNLWKKIVKESSFSFPSGHTMISWSLTLIVLITISNAFYGAAIIVAAVLYGLLVAFSRLYLGVHYPTDIIGGWVMSSIWIFLIYSIFYSDLVLIIL